MFWDFFFVFSVGARHQKEGTKHRVSEKRICGFVVLFFPKTFIYFCFKFRFGRGGEVGRGGSANQKRKLLRASLRAGLRAGPRAHRGKLAPLPRGVSSGCGCRRPGAGAQELAALKQGDSRSCFVMDKY